MQCFVVLCENKLARFGLFDVRKTDESGSKRLRRREFNVVLNGDDGVFAVIRQRPCERLQMWNVVGRFHVENDDIFFRRE